MLLISSIPQDGFQHGFILAPFSQYTNRKEPVCVHYHNAEVSGLKDETSRWKLKVYPVAGNLPAGVEKKSHVGMYLGLENTTDVEVQAFFTFRIINQNREILKSASELSHFFGVKDGKEQPAWGKGDFVSHDDIIKNSFLQNDSLYLQADIRFKFISGGPLNQLVSASAVFMRALTRLHSSSQKTDFRLISSDGQIFPVHKFIISMQSDVFTAMFASDMKELASGQCTIHDVDGQTLSALIKFLYGQNCWNSSLLDKLLQAAHKYKVEALEKACMRALLKDLTHETAASFLQVATDNCIEPLKAEVLKFIGNDFTEFIAAGGFLKLRDNLGLLETIREEAETRKAKKFKPSP